MKRYERVKWKKELNIKDNQTVIEVHVFLVYQAMASSKFYA